MPTTEPVDLKAMAVLFASMVEGHAIHRLNALWSSCAEQDGATAVDRSESCPTRDAGLPREGEVAVTPQTDEEVYCGSMEASLPGRLRREQLEDIIST